ncbi:hypothetical protein BOX15_Mlig027287g1 [Macrostomum lignano]|uniref:Regulator of telomere elongation helicase 1 homolog n=1 Tax=Macrostomum lignano TaxID=282301 RepID=A0A267E8V4_9PLAT|nr:hypothetical protein BOX15_Mlig027287g1 [Macrostomum lignano]
MTSQLRINGIDVSFPFEPYPCQVEYMRKVLQALQTGQNALLESPTGTGKSLSLLCAALAWQAAMKARQQAFNAQASSAGGEKNSAAVELIAELERGFAESGGAWDPVRGAPRIIYASRTHSQLSQAMHELKRTVYTNHKVAIIGSRDQLCINEDVQQLESNAAKMVNCKVRVETRSCQYYLQYDLLRPKNDKDSAPAPLLSNKIMDIEDLVDYGKRTKCCPYFMSRDQKESADIIFMPYNYLLDPKVRYRNKVDLEGNVVILDEAHNIEQVCEDGASVELSSVDLAQCIFEIDAAVSGLMKKITADQQASSLSLENLSGAEAQESLDFTVSDLFALKGQLLALEKAIDSIPLGSGDSAGPGFTKPGAYVLELLAQADITAPRVAHMLDRLDKILAFMSSTQGRLFRGTGLSRLSEFIAGVFPQSSYCDPAVSSASGSSSSSSGSSTQRRRGLPSSSSGLAQCYKLHIREVSGGHYGRSGATSAPAATVGFDTDASAAASSGPAGSGKPYRLLSYWCFSPAKAMLDLAAHGVRSIILTSGTLYPMEALRQDLQLPFPIELSNPHVIDRDQIITAVVPRGPNSVRLSSGYENRDSLDYQRALGECVASLCGCVPHGLLVFFPSYSLMSRCLDAWRSSRLFDRISSRKPVFVEPRRKAEFATAFADYYKRVCDPQYAGAIFLAVCRGKVSEGLDFADHFGRAVVVTGLPYPMWTDPRVRLKQAWLDEQRLATGRGLTGKQWYKQQAYRAVNQAIGRVLRHRNDYGAVLLCDERFATEESRRQLPAWLQHSVTVAKTFESVPDRLREFFASNSVKYPTPDGPKMRLPAKQQQMQFDGQSAAAFEFGSAATHQLKAQAGAGPVYGSSVSPLIGGGRAGTVIEFLHSYEKSPALDELANLYCSADSNKENANAKSSLGERLRLHEEEMAQNSVQTPSESASSRVEEGAAGRSKHVAFQTESAAESQADAAAAVKQDGDFKVPLAAPPNSRRRLRISGSVAKSSLSPSPSPSATPKPTPASPSNPFSKPSPPSPDVSELRLTLQQALGQGERCRFRSALAEYKSSGGVDRLIGRLAEIFQAAARVASAGGPRGEPAAVRQLLFGLGRLIRTPDRARYEQCRERLAEAAADGLAKAVAAITGGGAVLADQSTAASKAKVDDLDEGEDDDDGAALRPPAKRLKSGHEMRGLQDSKTQTRLWPRHAITSAASCAGDPLLKWVSSNAPAASWWSGGARCAS